MKTTTKFKLGFLRELGLVVAALMIVMTACKKTPVNPPVNNPAPGAFQNIMANGEVKLTLLPAAANNLVSTSYNPGDTIMDTINDGWLMINGKGSAVINVADVDSLGSNGNGSIIGTGPFQFDYLAFAGNGKMDTASINLQTPLLVVGVNGDGNYHFEGTADQLHIGSVGDGRLYGFGLASKNCTVLHVGGGDIEVFVTDTLDVTIVGTGNVKYMGNPKVVIPKVVGPGQLIKL